MYSYNVKDVLTSPNANEEYERAHAALRKRFDVRTMNQEKYINWNTIAVVYAFKLVYNKQTVAYFCRLDFVHNTASHIILHVYFFPNEMALLLHFNT